MASVLPPFNVNNETVKFNLFSKHDNRYSTQYDGIHLGGKHGRKHIQDPSRNQHLSDNHISWGAVVGYGSTYSAGYSDGKGRNVDGLVSHSRCSSAEVDYCSHSTHKAKRDLLEKYHNVPTKDNFRRFPKKYLLPVELDEVQPTYTTVWWSLSSRPKPHTIATPLSVLGITQQPYRAKNMWKYSYRVK